jgi:hypothetical protein
MPFEAQATAFDVKASREVGLQLPGAKRLPN